MARWDRDSVALVTGGTSGIGLALVEALYIRGIKVRFCARNARQVAALEQRLAGTRGFVCDVQDELAVGAMLADLAATDGRLDLLVAGVGLAEPADFSAAPLSPDAIKHQIDLNLAVPILTINAALPLMRQRRGGHIVAVGSGYGWSPSARVPIYSAAKAGLRSFLMGLRAQLEPHDIHVMEVVPPLVDTPAVAHLDRPKLAPEEVARLTLRGIERRREAVFPGQTRAIPVMLRLAPGMLRSITLRS